MSSHFKKHVVLQNVNNGLPQFMKEISFQVQILVALISTF